MPTHPLSCNNAELIRKTLYFHSAMLALAQAIAEQVQIIPLFIVSPYLLTHAETGSGRVQFLLSCLDSLQKNLAYLGSTLVRRSGDQEKVLIEVVREFGADTVYWNVNHERAWRPQTDHSIAIAL